MRLVTLLYGTLSWGIVLLGTVHMLTTAALCLCGRRRRIQRKVSWPFVFAV